MGVASRKQDRKQRKGERKLNRRFLPAVAGILVAVVFLSTNQVRAAENDADDLLRQGVERRRQNDDLGALRLFERAYERDKTPRALAQVGLAEQALGRWVVALQHLREALGFQSDEWIIKNRAAIIEAEDRLKDHIGWIDILGGSSGSDVRLDGVLRGKLPLANRLASTTGVVAIELSDARGLRVQRTTTVRARETTRESFEVTAAVATNDQPSVVDSPRRVDSPTNPSPAGEGKDSVNGSSDAGATSDGPKRQMDSGQSSLRLPIVITTSALSLGALAVGVVEHLAWQKKANSFAGMSSCDGNLSDKGGAGCMSLFNEGRHNKDLAILGYVTSGVLAVSSAILFVVLDHPSRDSKFACSSSEFPLSATCAFRF